MGTSRGERRPLDPWLFRLEGGGPVLSGSRCEACDDSFFPRRRLCPVCLRDTVEVELARRGVLHSHTYVHVPSVVHGRLRDGGYGVGEVDLADGPRVQTVLAGAPESWEIGMAMRIDSEVVDQLDGDDVVMFCFRPETRAGDA
jgi:uncharacterized OB-fold protein